MLGVGAWLALGGAQAAPSGIEVSTATAQVTSNSAIKKHAGKAGFYLRLAKTEEMNNPDFYIAHPLVDAVVVTYGWADIEPSPGQYDFAQIDRMTALCRKHGKGVVLSFSTQGQKPDKQPTPEWLYDKGVKRIQFNGGGVAKGKPITVPKSWEPAFLREYETFIRKIGQRYNGQEGVWYVMPGFGHVGNINAQPSGGGCQPFLAEGWTPDIWKDYCRKVASLYTAAFPDTPLIVKSANHLLRDKAHDFYAQEADDILVDLGKQGISAISFGLEPDIALIRKNRVLDRFVRLEPYAMNGRIRAGIGDDWPLWVSEERRKKARFLAGRDENGLERELQYAFGGVEGLPPTHVSVMYVLHPEIEASHPDKGAEQNKRLFQILEAARNRLKAEDPIAQQIKAGRNAASPPPEGAS